MTTSSYLWIFGVVLVSTLVQVSVITKSCDFDKQSIPQGVGSLDTYEERKMSYSSILIDTHEKTGK